MFNESDFNRWREDSNQPFYHDDDLTNSELEAAKKHWRQQAKEMTYGQVLQTAADNRSMTSVVYMAMQESLRDRSIAAERRAHRA
jgi:hypothetical protein